MGGSIDNIISGITAPVPQEPAQTEQEEATPLPTAKKVGRKKKDITHVTNTAVRLKALSIKTGQTASSIVDYVLSKVLDNYEKTNGELTIVPKKKKELSDFLD